ncbi:hypothetical protein EJ03DRAFT_330893 [Teratosphaeria nubilosa]|uniref:Amino acid transporter transmembrane domain-containing protein n=1 Tax=Teratosphaeria nubilosa TaxID=161662 RepID=A0A6G1KY30_9PEZI|nr:hypothetical protein EJ03DRAFT_330893 [Teratosphaeria nubilosa]
MTWPLTVGFLSVLAGVLVVVIGVTLRDRPAAAPQTGPFDLGFKIIACPTFAAGMTASATIFISSSAGPGYTPVLAEMRNPRQYKIPLLINCLFVGSTYLSFSMVIYYWCGTWIASPSLASAGPACGDDNEVDPVQARTQRSHEILRTVMSAAAGGRRFLRLRAM